jgi:hypothetical protein
VGCGFFRKEGVGLTGKEVANGFFGFYSEVGQKLPAKISREREGPSWIIWVIE